MLNERAHTSLKVVDYRTSSPVKQDKWNSKRGEMSHCFRWKKNDLENGTKGHSRSLQMLPLSRMGMISYNWSVVTLSLSYIIFKIQLHLKSQLSHTVSFNAPNKVDSLKISIPYLVWKTRSPETYLVKVVQFYGQYNTSMWLPESLQQHHTRHSSAMLSLSCNNTVISTSWQYKYLYLFLSLHGILFSHISVSTIKR